MTDYIKFKKLLAWFVNQLNINNGVTDGEKVTGLGYNANSSLRKHYADCRNYTGFDLDCTINHQYGNYATTSNYINLADTDFNIIPEFNSANKAVTSFYIGNHPPKKPIDRKSESVSVASLGLGDAEPNQALRDYFDMFKQQILEYKSNFATASVEHSAETLGQMLKTMYDNAEKGKQVLSIHLFGIEYGHIITANNVRVPEIVSIAGLPTSYVTEVSKGISIGAELQKSKTIFFSETEVHHEGSNDDEFEDDVFIDKKEIEAMVLNYLGGLKQTHNILKQAKLYELSSGDKVLLRFSNQLPKGGYFYGLQKAIIDTVNDIDYMVLIRGNEGFYNFPFNFIKDLCLDGSIN
jgi:hypothetical protein